MGLEAFAFLQIFKADFSGHYHPISSPMLMIWLLQSRVAFYFSSKTSKQKTFRVFLITQGLERGLLSLGLDEPSLPGGQCPRRKASAQQKEPHWGLFLSQQPPVFKAASLPRPPSGCNAPSPRTGEQGFLPPAPPLHPLSCEPNLKMLGGKKNPIWD